MTTKTALIIGGVLLAVVGIGIYVHQRKLAVERLQMKIAKETGSIKDEEPAPHGGVVDNVLDSGWSLI